MSVHESAWIYRRFRWARISVALLATSTASYVVADPPAARAGDTVVGALLGWISAALIVWLTWFGVRKRSYGARGAPLHGWLSAHSYLGLSLLLLVPLHCAFQFGWNIHTLAYLLMTAVVLSGIVGVFYYATVPARMTENRPGNTLGGMFEQIAELDGECRNLAETLPDVFAAAVELSITETRFGGGFLRQLAGFDPRCGTARALEIVAAQMRGSELSQPASTRRLLETLSVKRAMVGTVRKEIRYKALLQFWLMVHVPLAVATLVAVAAHIAIVFLYR